MSDWWIKVQGLFGAGKVQAPSLVMNLLAQQALEPMFQPLVDVRSGVILGHEALVRVRRALADMSSEALLQAAQQEQCLKSVELACLELAMQRWGAQYGKGQLFVNFSAQTLVRLHASDSVGLLLELMQKHNMPARRMGVDVSGYTRIPRLEMLAEALRPLRDAGVGVALDNFKPSENGMRAWSVVLPHVVKMASRWTRRIAVDEEQSRVMRSMVRMARNHNALLLAKSVESEAELRKLKSLGVDMAQGFFLGSPATEPVHSLNLRAWDVLQVQEPAVVVPAVPSAPHKPMTRPPVLETRYAMLS